MARLRRVALLGILVFGVSSACRPKPGPGPDSGAPAALSPADEVKIRSVDSAFVAAANAGDAEAVAAVYSDGGAVLAPNLPPQ